MKKTKEVLLYVLFGGLTFVISQVSFILFIILNLGIPLSKIFSWVLAVSFAFVTNKQWVFRSPSWRFSVLLREAGIFFPARVITGIPEIIFVPLLSSIGFDTWMLQRFNDIGLHWAVLNKEGFFSNLLVTIVVIILNYFFSKFLVFRKKEK